MQGTWVLIRSEFNGADSTREGIKIIISESEISHEYRGQILAKGSIKSDPTKDPKTLDLISLTSSGKSEASLGIYQMKEDILKMCLSPPGQSRPVEFSCPR